MEQENKETRDPEQYQPTDKDYAEMDIVLFRDPLEKLAAKVAAAYHKNWPGIDELVYILNDEIDKLTEVKCGYRDVAHLNAEWEARHGKANS